MQNHLIPAYLKVYSSLSLVGFVWYGHPSTQYTDAQLMFVKKKKECIIQVCNDKFVHWQCLCKFISNLSLKRRKRDLGK